LNVAATANDTYASAYYAQDMGFFTRNGLNVDLTTMQSGAAITAAIVAGSIDVGVSTPIAIANAYLRGFPVVIVAAGSLSSASIKALLLCASKTSGIKTAKDLEGKVVAVNALKTGSELGLDAWLTQNGVDPAKVKVVETGFTEMGPAVDRGTVAAAVISEPMLSAALQQNNLQAIGDPNAAIAPQFLNSCWFSTKQFVQTKPEALRRFQKAIYEAQAWGNTHTAQSAVILAKYSKMDVSQVRSMTRSPYAVRLLASDVQPFLDAASKYGALSKPVSAADLIMTRA
jgi:NitT/TauT family transport system substrate-binding protein